MDLWCELDAPAPNNTGYTASMYFTNCPALVLLNGLAQCGTMPEPKKGAEIVNYTTTALLEQVLNCADRTDAWNQLKTRYPDVSDFQHQP